MNGQWPGVTSAAAANADGGATSQPDWADELAAQVFAVRKYTTREALVAQALRDLRDRTPEMIAKKHINESWLPPPRGWLPTAAGTLTPIQAACAAAITEAILAEREAIAKFVENCSDTGWIMTEAVAARIRARGGEK